MAGTGITPAYQLITTIFGKPDRPMPSGQRIPRISLMYAASKPSSLLLLPELAKLKEAYGNRLDVQLFVEAEEGIVKRSWLDWLLNKEHTSIQEGFPLQLGRLSDKVIKPVLEKHDSKSRHILVCGPDGMVAQVAGAKRGNQQGELSGILASLGCNQEEVHKL